MDAIEIRLNTLAQSGPLTTDKGLALASEIADLVERLAAPLEEVGDFEQAANLYEQAARAYELAADRVPDADREQVAASGEIWTVRADVIRYRVYTAPVGTAPSFEQQEASTTIELESSPPRPPTGPLKKLADPQDEPWTVTSPSSLIRQSVPLPSSVVKSRPGRWSVAQVPPQKEEVETLTDDKALADAEILGDALKKLDRMRKMLSGKRPSSWQKKP